MVGVWILLGASVIFVVNSVNMDSDLRYQSGALYQYLMSWWARYGRQVLGFLEQKKLEASSDNMSEYLLFILYTHSYTIVCYIFII
jgi:hypothetical protein